MKIPFFKRSSFVKDTSGNIIITAALTLPLVIGTMALGVDYGALTLQQRELQNNADLTAIIAASNPTTAESGLLNYFQTNAQNIVVRTPNGILTPTGLKPANTDDALFSTYDGVATITRGKYSADPTVAVANRFVPGATPADAIRVSINKKGQIYFAAAFATPPTLQATGTASAQKVAAFSVGSRLLSVNGGLLNAVLGGLLGTNLSLSVMDYQGLIAADVNVLSMIDALAINLNLKAVTYSDILKTQITYGDLLNAIGKTTGLTPSVTATVNTLNKSLSKTKLTLTLGQLFNLDPYGQRLLGASDNLQVNASVFDIVSAAAGIANGGKQVAVDLGATIPGLASAKLTLAIGEPPVQTPMLALGTVGSVVRTAQTRVGLDLSINGLAAIAGLKIHVPVYVEVAYAEAKLASISCLGGSTRNANVGIEAVPGVAEVALGDVDPSVFANFSTKPRVTETAILDSLLLKVTGMADVNITNLTKTTLTFSPTDIGAQKIKTISTANTLTSAIQSLLKSLTLKIQILGLTLGTPTAVQSALADTLSLVSTPLDSILYNTLLVLGIRIGEADIRVTDVRCQSSVLVQ